MADLGYVYNRSAANLRTSNAGLIGLVINDLRNPFFTEFATSVQMAFSARGYATVIANTDENAKLQAQVVGAMIEHGVSALVLSPTYGLESDTFGPLERAGIPAMQVLRDVDQRHELFPFSSFDYSSGSRAAAEHLVAKGARKIAFVGGLSDRPITTERVSGYLSVMRERGLDPLVLEGRATRAFGHESALRLCSEFARCGCGHFVQRPSSARHVVRLPPLRPHARQGFPPRRFRRYRGVFTSLAQLSSVRCDIAEFGRRTARTILDWLEDGIKPVPKPAPPVHLVIRDSSGGLN